VRDLIHKKRLFVGKRVKEFREKLGLSHAYFAKGCGLSKGTIVTIESGKAGYIIDSLLAITYFLGMELEEILDPAIETLSRDVVVERMIAFHKQHRSKAYLILNKKPRLSNILKERLLQSDFLLEPREIGEIVAYCKEEYQIELESSSVSNAMKKLKEEELIKIIRSPKGRNKLYKKVLRKK
jgi:transcriptional regulator with XRE-family HTH domain